MALTIAATPSGAAPTPRARAYLDHAMALMRAHAIYAPREGWNAVVRRVHADDTDARTFADEYPQLRYTLGRLAGAGDAHAGFADPKQAAAWGPNGSALAGKGPMPKVSLAKGRFGIVALPGVPSDPSTPSNLRYERTALMAIGRIDQASHPCGWIVDVRGNGGGNIIPMVLAVGPLLGSGDVMTYLGKKAIVGRMRYGEGSVTVDAGTESYTFRAPVTVADLEPAPPVALVTDWDTASSAEAVVIAFRSRAQVRSFGATTVGATGMPEWFTLRDGAMLIFATAWMADVHGVAPKGPLAPDESTNTPVLAAERWLATTDACTAAATG